MTFSLKRGVAMVAAMCKSQCAVSSEVSISSCGTWVHTRVDGPITRESALEYITEAAREADTRGLSSFLFDLRRASNAKNIFDDYDIAHHQLRKLGFNLASKVALLVGADDRTHDFFELTAANAGHNWRVFNDEEAAADWLGHKQA